MLIKRKMNPRKFKIFFMMLIFLIVCTNTYGADVDMVLNDIEQNMKNVKTVRAEFVQKKTMAMFDMPVTINGKLFIENPDKFSWVVKNPIEYTLIVTKNRVKKWDPSNGVHELSLKKNPMFKAMIEQITFWFSGSYASCKNDYHIELLHGDSNKSDESGESILLRFTPKEHNQTSKMLSSITLSFENNKKYISKIQLLEKNSDITEIIFKKTIINSEIDKSVWEIN